MSIKNFLKSLFESDKDVADTSGQMMNIDPDLPRDFELCVVGNIIDKHYYGPEKEVRRGTKHFGPGTKVYIIEFTALGNPGSERVRVMGAPRKSDHLIDVTISAKHIENHRVQKVYHPKIKNALSEQPLYKNLNINELEVQLRERKKWLAGFTKHIIDE